MTPAAEAALPFAKQGWKLFPAKWDGTNHIGYVKWGKNSSSDPKQLEAWSKQFPEAYYCANLGASHLTAVDVDTKNGKKGREVLSAATNGNGPFPPTMQSLTPNGGDHYIFEGTCARGANKLGPGVDIAVMVPLPGQTVPGKGEYKLVRAAVPAKLPAWVVEMAGQATERKENHDIPLCDWDLPHNVERFKKYLIDEAPEAIEGEGGDETTKNIATVGRDLAVSRDTAFTLMAEHWNETKARPPWLPQDLEKKVRNGYKYAKDRAGNATVDAKFPDPLKISDSAFLKSASDILNNPVKIEWVVPGYIEKNTTILWFSGYAQFKSFLALKMAITKATGGTWAGKKVQEGVTWYLQGEGHGGTARRLKAACRELDIQDGQSLPVYFSAFAVSLSDEQSVAFISELAKNFPPPELLIIDTAAAHFGGGDENSTKDMTHFLKNVFTIRQKFGCAVLIIHHSGHSEKGRSRGASSLEAGVDAVYKITREDMHVCLNSPLKMKDGESPPDTWFRAEIVNVGLDEELNPITSIAMEFDSDHQPAPKVRKLGANQKFILEKIPPEGITQEGLKDAFKVFKGESYDRKIFSLTLKKLKDRGICYEDGKLLFRAI